MNVIYDSKLFYGTELGQLTSILSLFDFIPSPPKKPNDIIEQVGWINKNLPGNVFVEVTYPQLNCDSDDMVAHLNLLDDVDEFDAEDMDNFLRTASIGEYGYVLGMLRFDYVAPVFYTRHYIYK